MLKDVVDLIPEQYGDKKTRKRLRKLARQLDGIAVEEGSTLIVDRKVLRRIVKDSGAFPKNTQRRVLKEMEAHLGKKVKKKSRAGRTLRWQELAAHDKGLHPVPASELRAMGIKPSTSPQDAERILRSKLPGKFPDELFDAKPKELRDIATKAISHNRTVWDCVESKMGYWATLGIFAALGALLIIATATIPWGTPLIIFLAGTVGFGSAVIVANCIMNPNWR